LCPFFMGTEPAVEAVIPGSIRDLLRGNLAFPDWSTEGGEKKKWRKAPTLSILRGIYEPPRIDKPSPGEGKDVWHQMNMGILLR
jgi:hypothetical protein